MQGRFKQEINDRLSLQFEQSLEAKTENHRRYWHRSKRLSCVTLWRQNEQQAKSPHSTERLRKRVVRADPFSCDLWPVAAQVCVCVWVSPSSGTERYQLNCHSCFSFHRGVDGAPAKKKKSTAFQTISSTHKVFVACCWTMSGHFQACCVEWNPHPFPCS